MRSLLADSITLARNGRGCPEGHDFPPDTLERAQNRGELRARRCVGVWPKNALQPWRQKMWSVPKIDGEYVARMEDVLDLYAQTPDPQPLVVCFDESPVQLIGETRSPIPAAPG